MQPLTLKYEKSFLRAGVRVVIGCDEVGRGALAGPVVGAAVVFPSTLSRVPSALRSVHDSKVLSPEVRRNLSAQIKCFARAWSVTSISAAVIDRIGIQEANMRVLQLAVTRVMEQLSKTEKQSVHVLVDGRAPIPLLALSQETMVHGDGLVFSIAAASILAKVTRDSFMERQDSAFPGYDFGSHKGYGSSAHRGQIRELGLSSLHRKTFCGRIDEWDV